MIKKKDLEKEIQYCENMLKALYKEIDIAEEEKNEDDYNYFQRCAAEQEDYIEIFKYLKEKYCNKE